MDILDILVARALTPQGQIEQYAALSQKAIAKANKAISNANEVIDNIDTITEQTNTNNTNAAAALEDANAALELVNDALAQIDDNIVESIDDEIDKLAHTLVQNIETNYTSYDFVTTYPSGLVTTLQNLIKYYNAPGQNIDGTMTQKAITDALAEAGSNIHFDTNDAGNMTVVKSDGRLGASEVL